MSTLNIQLLCRRSIDFQELAIFASRTGAMINLHWLELPMARTIFHGPKVFEPLKFDCICMLLGLTLICLMLKVGLDIIVPFRFIPLNIIIGVNNYAVRNGTEQKLEMAKHKRFI